MPRSPSTTLPCLVSRSTARRAAPTWFEYANTTGPITGTSVNNREDTPRAVYYIHPQKRRTISFLDSHSGGLKTPTHSSSVFVDERLLLFGGELLELMVARHLRRTLLDAVESEEDRGADQWDGYQRRKKRNIMSVGRSCKKVEVTRRANR